MTLNAGEIRVAGATAPVVGLPTQDAYVEVLLRTEAMLNDAFEKLDKAHQREVLDEIERRRRLRLFANPSPAGLVALFPSLAMRRH